MNTRRKIFILYARFGEGHWQAANALSHSFLQIGNTDVKLIDLLAESHPVVNEVSRYVYSKSYSFLPQVYGWVYDATKGMKSNSLFASWLHSFGTVTLQRLIEKEQPDAIVHTFPILALPLVTQKTGRKIPMFNVVTDFDLHLRWVHPDVDKYYVATEDISKQLNKLGVHPHRVAVTGIPIRPTFLSKSTASQAAFRYGLPSNKPIILVMASQVVRTDIAELCRLLILRLQAEIVVVCGKDRTLLNALISDFRSSSDVTVLGFVDHIDELMAISSCVITKPGGLTLSEAIAAELPILLYRPVPGQERDNARYLESKGAAVISRSVEQLVEAAAGILHNPMQRKEMHQALQALRKEGAANSIALDISSQLHIMEGVPSDPILVQG